MSINKTPGIKKAILISRPSIKDASKIKNFNTRQFNSTERAWQDKKTFFLPLMPSDVDEKDAYLEKEYRCSYCDQLSDDQTLECKVCSRVAHIDCLYRRGHLSTQQVAKKLEWSCSDCCDLSKCLNDDEMRKIINLFDELDFRKNCYVTYVDYMDVKKKLYLKDGEEMNDEKLLEEEKKFRLMDKDNSGSITWNEFVEYEAANLLSKKNKIELSNYLTIKELINAKKLFLSHDKDKQQMINKEDSKKCYIEYIQKLRLKLGPIFSEHISNCIDIFGLNPQGENKTNSAKTMWPEFIRKMTILILYDRLNLSVFTPKYWKPGLWYSMDTNRTYRSNLSSRAESTILPFIETSRALKNDDTSVQKMSKNNFGSHEFVIRSNRNINNSSLSMNDNYVESEDEYDILVNDHFKPKPRKVPKRKVTRSQHESLRTNRIFKNSIENFNDVSFLNDKTTTKHNFHLPNLINNQFDTSAASSQNYFAPSKPNKYFSQLNNNQSERTRKNDKNFQIDFKYQNELNFVNKVIANY